MQECLTKNDTQILTTSERECQICIRGSLNQTLNQKDGGTHNAAFRLVCSYRAAVAMVPDEVQDGVDSGHVGRGPGAADVRLGDPGFDGDHQDDAWVRPTAISRLKP